MLSFFASLGDASRHVLIYMRTKKMKTTFTRIWLSLCSLLLATSAWAATPVYLFDAGSTPANPQGDWVTQTADISNFSAPEVTSGFYITTTGSSDDGLHVFANSNGGHFPTSDGAFVGLDGESYTSVLAEMTASLGLSELPANIVDDGLQAWGQGAHRDVTVHFPAVDDSKSYVLYFVFDTSNNNTDWGGMTFSLIDSANYGSHTQLDYVNTSTATAYTAQEDKTAEISVSSGSSLLVRLAYFSPDSNNQVKFKVSSKGGIGAIAIAEMPNPYVKKRAISSEGGVWNDTTAWGGALPGAETDVTLIATGDATLTMDTSSTIASLTLNGDDTEGTDTVRIVAPESNAGTLTSTTTAVNVNTDVSAITTSLGTVTIADGKALTMAAGSTILSLTAESGTRTLTGGTVASLTNKAGSSLTLSNTIVTAVASNAGTIYLQNYAMDQNPRRRVTRSKVDFSANEQYVANAESSELIIYGNNNVNNLSSVTDGNEFIRVTNGATLRLAARDFGGWGSFTGDKLRVYVGGSDTLSTLELFPYTSGQPGCFTGNVVLDKKAKVIGDENGGSLVQWSAGSATTPNVIVKDNATAEWSTWYWRNANTHISVGEGGVLTFSAVLRARGNTTSRPTTTSTELHKYGAGVLDITAAQNVADTTTFNGATTVHAGTLKLSGVGTLGSSAVTIAEGATLELAGTAAFENAISGAGTLKKTGTGNVTLTAEDVEGFTGSIEATVGEITLPLTQAKAATIGSGVTLNVVLTEQEMAADQSVVKEGVTVVFKDEDGTTLASEGGTYTAPIKTWTITSADSVNWSVATWSPAAPEDGDIACIDVGANNVTVTMDAADTLKTLVVKGTGTLTFEGENALTVTDLLDVQGNLTVASTVMILPETAIEAGCKLTYSVPENVTVALPRMAGEGTFQKTGAGAVRFDTNLHENDMVAEGITIELDAGAYYVGLNDSQAGGDPYMKDVTIKFLNNGVSFGSFGWLHLEGTVTIDVPDTVTDAALGSLPNKMMPSLQGADATLVKTGAGQFTACLDNIGTTRIDAGTIGLRGEKTVPGVITGEGAVTIVGTDVVTLSGNNTYTGGTEVTSDATLKMPLKDNMSAVVNGTLIYEFSANTDMRTWNLSGVTGTGTIHLKSENKWIALPKVSGNCFASSLSLHNNTGTGGVIFQQDEIDSNSVSYEFQNLYGAGRLRCDLTSGRDTVAYVKTVLTASQEISGDFYRQDGRCVALTVASDGTEPSAEKTLTISNASNDSTQTLTIESTGSVNLTGLWDGPVSVAGMLSGTGTISGAVTLADGATLDASAGALTVNGAVTCGGALKVKLATAPTADYSVLAATSITGDPTVEIYIADATVPSGDYYLEQTDTALVVKKIVAWVDDTPYASLSDALTAALEGSGTVELYAATSDAVEVAAGSLKLVGEGALYTGTLTIADGATVTLKGDGDFINGLDGLEGSGTLVIDATAGAITIGDTMKEHLQGFAGTVIFKGDSTYGVTLDYGVDNGNGALKATFVFDGGVHNFTYGCSWNTYNYAAGRGDDKPYIIVQNSAHLNFTMKDLSGWDGDTPDSPAVIAVNSGTLTFKQHNAATGYFRERIVLADGTTLTLDDGNASGEDNFFNVYGGLPDAYTGAQLALSAGSATITGDRILSKGEYGFGVEDAAAVLTVESKLTGSDAWKKVGAGTLKLTNSETDVSGALTIAEGKVLVADGASLGTSDVTVTATLEVEATTDRIFDNRITGDGTFVKSGAGALTLANAAEFSGTINVTAGTLVLPYEGVLSAGETIVLLPNASFSVAEGANVVVLVDGVELSGTVTDGKLSFTAGATVASSALLRISEIMPKGSEKETDPNGLESGWVELVNTSTTEWVDLADYRFIRINRCKEVKSKGFGNFPSMLIPPGGRFVFYTSEMYPNGKGWVEDGELVGLFGTVDADAKGKPIAKFYTAGEPGITHSLLVWPDKVNPKKHPFVRLYYAPDGDIVSIQDTVVVPSDLPESASIVLADADATQSTLRWYDPNPTPGEANNSTEGLTRLGPNVGPLYEFEWNDDYKKKYVESEFQLKNFTAPATAGQAYTVTLPINPVMAPTGETANAMDAITSVTLIYRKGFGTGTIEEGEPITMTASSTAGEYNWGTLYTATIPAEFITETDKGHLIQWKVEITDDSGETWTSPSFHNKDDGYEWYGTIVADSSLESEKLATWHMFADSASVVQMDKDADDQTLPNNARVAIYDSSTSTYYDYVRIDLRGNTSANFSKKSHGLRFAKAHPMIMDDSVTGEEMETECRKSSLISEYGDPSWMRQMVAFWLFNEMGNKVPFDFPVRCNLNGEFYQLAFHSERFTDELIEDFYGLDKFGYGYKNVGTLKSGSGTSAGGIEKKTPDDGNEGDILVLEEQLRAPLKAYGAENDNTTEKPALTKFVVQAFDLPAWLNYIASSKITHETDDVWANISAYYDSPTMRDGSVRGTGTWMPLAYDFNLSFGQSYYNDVDEHPGLMADEDWFKSHPFYGGNRVRCYRSSTSTTTVNSGNSAYEAIFQSPKFRRLYLRRLRTLMDQHLGAPVDLTNATDAELLAAQRAVPFMAKMLDLAELMRADAALDQVKWPNNGTDNAIDVWQNGTRPADMDAGIQEIWTNYVVPRRIHLYETHSINNTTKGVGYDRTLSAGIPAAQSSIADLKAGISVTWNATLQAMVITNTNAETIDISGWTLAGPVEMTLPAGTVLDQAIDGVAGEVYVTADRRTTIEKFGDKLSDQVVVGNGTAAETADLYTVTLKDASGTLVHTTVVSNGDTLSITESITVDAIDLTPYTSVVIDNACLTVTGVLTFGDASLTVYVPALTTTTEGFIAIDAVTAPEAADQPEVTICLKGETAPWTDATATWTDAGDLCITAPIKIVSTTQIPDENGTPQAVALSEGTLQSVLAAIKTHNATPDITPVKEITEVTVTNSAGTAKPTHTADAAELFTNVVTIAPTSETPSTATAKIAYDFGIERFTIRHLDSTQYLIVKAKVHNGRDSSADIPTTTLVNVYRQTATGDTVETAADPIAGAIKLPADQLSTLNETSSTGEVWIAIPLADTIGDALGTHRFIIRAEKAK